MQVVADQNHRQLIERTLQAVQHAAILTKQWRRLIYYYLLTRSSERKFDSEKTVLRVQEDNLVCRAIREGRSFAHWLPAIVRRDSRIFYDSAIPATNCDIYLRYQLQRQFSGIAMDIDGMKIWINILDPPM